MVGGPQATFDRLLPLLQLMGKNITLVGGNGNGQTTKVANQIIVALQGARALGVSLPQTASAAQLMQACAAQGWDQLDHSALAKALELMAKHTVTPDA